MIDEPFSRHGWPQMYILVGHEPMAVDMLTWAKWIEKIDNRKVALTEINNKCEVSTIFLGLDHNWFGDGPPILFETMIFGGPLNREGQRYATWEQAERGHEEWVVQARKACAQVEIIAKNAGAE